MDISILKEGRNGYFSLVLEKNFLFLPCFSGEQDKFQDIPEYHLDGYYVFCAFGLPLRLCQVHAAYFFNMYF